MENNFHNDSFEDFLKDEVGSQKMYPSDAVWREINNRLHGERRWPALTVATFLIIGITTAICLHFSPRQNIFVIKPSLQPLAGNMVQSPEKAGKSPSALPVYQFTQHTTKALARKSSDVALNMIAANTDNAVQSDISLADADINAPTLSNESEQNEGIQTALLPANKTVEAAKLNGDMPDQVEKTFAKKGEYTAIVTKSAAASAITVPGANLLSAKEDNFNTTASTEDIAIPTVRKGVKSKWLLGFYLAPSISYRKLVEENGVLKNNADGPASLSQVVDVNDVVRHRPSNGLEGGFSLMYQVSNNVRFKTGIQFNVRQYAIEAYRATSEVSSIELVENNRIETINTITNYRNYNGNASTQLVNRYYQLSIPLGLEWQVFKAGRFAFNVAGSIQPTYMFNSSAYLLTTNFKNYTEKNDMVRQFNLNTNFETFITINAGDVQWQIGPQVRYQPYSSFIKQYPIREHLIDYGFKLGLIAPLH